MLSALASPPWHLADRDLLAAQSLVASADCS
jgi:hypothetical protein